MKVVVIGAGVAGLTATHELCKRGFEVVTLEANERVGGRTARIQEGGYIIDTGAQFMCKGYIETLKLCNEIGLKDEILVLPITLTMLNDGKPYDISMRLKPKVILDDLKYLFDVYGIKGFMGLSRFLLTMMKRWKQFGCFREEWLWDLDSRSMEDFALDVSNREVLEKLLQPVSSALMLEDPENIGAPFGLTCVWIILNGFLAGLMTMKRGIGSIADRIADMHSENIHLSMPARKVIIEDNRVKSVETDDGFIETDAVICATTASAALKLMPGLPPELKGPLGKAKYGRGCRVAIGVENRPFPHGHFGVIVPGTHKRPLAAVGSGCFLSEEIAPEGELLNCFIYGRHAKELSGMTDEEVTRIMVDEIRKLSMEIPEDLRLSRVFHFDEAVFSYPPGTLAELNRAGKESSSHVKGLHLAGEYLNMGAIEATVLTGKDAAERLARESGGSIDEPALIGETCA